MVYKFLIYIIVKMFNSIGQNYDVITIVTNFIIINILYFILIYAIWNFEMLISTWSLML